MQKEALEFISIQQVLFLSLIRSRNKEREGKSERNSAVLQWADE